MLELFLAGSMLVHTDITALQSSKLPPNATNSIAALQGATPRVLDRCTYATYPAAAPGTGLVIPMMYYFEAGEIGAGSQVRFKIGGTFINDGGSIYQAGAQMRITSGSTIVVMGSRAQAATTGAGISAVRAWETDCTITASISGASGQYLPNLKTGTRANPSTRPQSASISFTNVCKQLITDNSVASSPDFGGLILNGAANGSIMSSTQFQQVFSMSTPILMEVLVQPPILGVGTVGNMTIQMGYMEGL